MRIEPAKPPSSSPIACSMVDLPEPEGPRRATISPFATCRSTPRSTSMVTPACVKLRRRPRTSRMSLIAQDLDRVRVRRPPGGIEGEKEARADGDDDDHGGLDRR